MDIEKGSFSTASSITDGMATPIPVVARQSCFTRLALRLFPKNRSGSGKSNCFTSLNTNGSSQTLANKLATLKGAQEEESGAANMTVGFKMHDISDKLPLKGHYAIWTASKGYWLMEKKMIHPRSRPLFDKVFGKGSLKDIEAIPAAILPDYDNTVFGIFAQWTYDRGSRAMKSDCLFKETVCTREERVQTIDVIMELLFFAEDYKLDEFQDDVLELLINSCKEDKLPLDVSHAYECHNRTTHNSKIRAFFIDFVVFIIQEIDGSGNWRGKRAALNCGLSLNKRGTLLELCHLLEGGNIRHPYGMISDPRDAPSCVYHHHGRGEKCPHETLARSFVSKICKGKAWFRGVEL
ncbi:hypothetical protein BCON_0472g00070 [Botryotinia convoluta]|uniref:BTB domain-containing protein n=1 Tax=Botryotinia convoluta TaxID=54673 RepID=A0A4Z1H943_9HELO|nr:hypothetical protein BCON_0472g00070 [Botryotinia convoluta]